MKTFVLLRAPVEYPPLLAAKKRKAIPCPGLKFCLPTPSFSLPSHTHKNRTHNAQDMIIIEAIYVLNATLYYVLQLFSVTTLMRTLSRFLSISARSQG